MKFHTVATEALKQYDIQMKSIHRLAEETNLFYLIKTDDSSYALKIYSDEASDINDSLTEHYFLGLILSKTEIQTPRVIPNKQGETVTKVPFNNKRGYKRVALYDYLPGESFAGEETETYFQEIGRVVAKMHLATKGTQFPEFVNPTRWDKVFYLEEEKVVYHDSKYAKFLTPEMIQILDELIPHIDIVLNNLYDTRDPRLIHADLTPWNIKQNEFGYIIYDFEEALMGYPVMDIANFMYYYRTRDDIDFFKAKTNFMSGYRSVNSIPIIDDRLFELVMIAKRIRLFNYVLTIQKNPTEYIKLSFPRIKEYFISYK
ncbi:MAG: phosphotransferase [Bacilli bacterium]|nr:phosphotransferase [Bacilli bacterium]MBN2877141.1 phosphotransferase [Bacilli bacterium]